MRGNEYHSVRSYALNAKSEKEAMGIITRAFHDSWVIDQNQFDTLKIEIGRKFSRRGFLSRIAWAPFAFMLPHRGRAQNAQEHYEYAHDLYRKLVDTFNLNKKPVIQKGATKTILLIGDRHGTNENEISRALQLATKFKINTWGIEGWAGHDVDNKRGYQLLNAEEKFNQFLLSNPNNFVALPLEDPKTQELFLKVTYWSYCYVLHWLHAKEDIQYNRERSERKINSRKQYLTPEQLAQLRESEEQEIIAITKRYEKTFSRGVRIAMESKCQGRLFHITPQNFEEQMLLIAKELQSYEKFNPSDYDESKRVADKFRQEIALDLRTDIGVQKMIAHMEKRNIQVACMIFGHLHIPRIYEQLVAKNCNVIVF